MILPLWYKVSYINAVHPEKGASEGKIQNKGFSGTAKYHTIIVGPE